MEGTRPYKINGTYYIFSSHPSAAAEYVLKASGDIWSTYTAKVFLSGAVPQPPLTGSIGQGALIDTPGGQVRQCESASVFAQEADVHVVVLDGLQLVLPERPRPMSYTCKMVCGAVKSGPCRLTSLTGAAMGSPFQRYAFVSLTRPDLLTPIPAGQRTTCCDVPGRSCSALRPGLTRLGLLHWNEAKPLLGVVW